MQSNIFTSALCFQVKKQHLAKHSTSLAYSAFGGITQGIIYVVSDATGRPPQSSLTFAAAVKALGRGRPLGLHVRRVSLHGPSFIHGALHVGCRRGP
jgi:hypothetical protein